ERRPGLPERPQGAKSSWRRVRRLRRPRRTQEGHSRVPAGSGVATLLRAFFKERHRSSAKKARRRLPERTRLALRAAQCQGGSRRPQGVDRALGEPLSQTGGVGRGEHRGESDLLLAVTGSLQERDDYENAVSILRCEQTQ